MADEGWEARGQVLRERLAEILSVHGGKLRLRGVENGFLISVLSFLKESGLSRKELARHLGLPEFQVDYLRQQARRRARREARGGQSERRVVFAPVRLQSAVEKGALAWVTFPGGLRLEVGSVHGLAELLRVLGRR